MVHRSKFFTKAGLVDKYINTAYDVVKSVHDNLDKIHQIYSALQDAEEQFNALLQEYQEHINTLLQEFQENINNFNNSLPERAPRLTLEEQRRDLLINDAVESGGWDGIRTAQQELADRYEGARFAASDLATCVLQPPSEAGLFHIASRNNIVNYMDKSYRAIPINPSVILPDSLVAPPLFKPIRSNDYGFLIWRYIGTKPITALMRGTIKFMHRHSDSGGDNAVNNMYLRLQAFNYPQLEDGQHIGGRMLSTVTGLLSEPKQLRQHVLNDFCMPYNQSIVDSAVSLLFQFGELWPGSETGWISGQAGDNVDEDLQDDEPGTRTTLWFDVSEIQGRHILFEFEGISTRSRVQIKRADDSIYYDNQSGLTQSANRLFRVPKDAVEMRIYYNGPTDTVDDNTATIRVVSESLGIQFDPIAGYWTEETFDVHREVTFWPGVDYMLRLVGTSRNGSTFRTYSYRFLGGALSFEFDAREMRKQLGDLAYVGNSL